ncbi:MAG: hypothetical protein HQK60_16005 [Deltaproteobacteria bacterium]|nr:hypothetical protein [Deltaproteobacteria bacterium]
MQRVAVVYVGIDFKRIDEINLGNQDFTVEGFLWFKWQDEYLRFRGKDRFMTFWNGILGSYDKLDLISEGTEGKVRHVAYRLGGKFKKDYWLRQFPFDVQALTVELSISDYDTDRVLLVADRAHLHSAQDMAGQDILPAGYELTAIDHSSGTRPFDSSLGHDVKAGHRSEFSVYQASMVVQRMPFPYFLKLFLPLFILIVVSLTAYLVPLGDLSVKTSLGLTTLLSAIVLHLSQIQSMPNVGYLTRIDYCFIFAYTIMMFNIVASIYRMRVARSRSVEYAIFFGRVVGLLIASNVLIVSTLLTIPGISMRWSVWITCAHLIAIPIFLFLKRPQSVKLTSVIK